MIDSTNLKSKGPTIPAGGLVKNAPPDAWNHLADAKVCSHCGQTISPSPIQGIEWKGTGTAIGFNAKGEEMPRYKGSHADVLAKLKADGILWDRLPFVVGKPSV